MANAGASPKVLRITAQHPSLPGHFPGNPIVPGVVILSSVFETLEHENPEWKIAGIKKLKFLQPLLPDQEFAVEYGEVKNSGLRFSCIFPESGTSLVEGHLKLAQRGTE